MHRFDKFKILEKKNQPLISKGWASETEWAVERFCQFLGNQSLGSNWMWRWFLRGVAYRRPSAIGQPLSTALWGAGIFSQSRWCAYTVRVVQLTAQVTPTFLSRTKGEISLTINLIYKNQCSNIKIWNI